MGHDGIFTHVDVPVKQCRLDESERSHYYITEEGKKYPSITTILNKTKPAEEKAKIAAWRDETGQALADHIFREAGIIGTQAHKLNENYLKMAQEEDDYKLISHAHHANLRPLLDKIDNIRGLEMRLYSDEYQMAGTADCIAEYDGELAVIDYKTKRSHRRREWLMDYFLQTAAYSIMYEERTGHRAERLVVLVSSEDNTRQEFVEMRQDHAGALMDRLARFVS